MKINKVIRKYVSKTIKKAHGDNQIMPAHKPNYESFAPSSDDIERVSDQLTAFSISAGGPNWSTASYAFRAVTDGKTVGEIIGEYNSDWGSAQISLLHVNDNTRGQHVGSTLVKMAEDFAKAQGCTVMQVSTASWQGEGFYEKVGYREIGRTELRKLKAQGRDQFHIMYDKMLI
jgi:ribosomal protein S18 acetylase RimI-like enzyme